jgi:signal transduction histidine kinase
MASVNDVMPRVRTALLAGSRGLVLAVLAPSLNIALLIATILSLVFLPLGVGIFLFPEVVMAVRPLAEQQRRWAAEWCGVAVGTPYQSAVAPGQRAGMGPLKRCKTLLVDPATWRDLAWLAAEIPVGLVLGALAAGSVYYGLEGVLIAPWIGLVTQGYGWGPFWPLDALTSVLSVPLGLGLLASSQVIAPLTLKGHAYFVRSLLAPTEAAALSARVRELTETRSTAVDQSAAELRRIERDLHDGAQARLAALGMTLGLAESLHSGDPEAAMRLVAEARETGNQALADLRTLVRGIHPPVLAERGLPGAVQALALSLPLPVSVEGWGTGWGTPSHGDNRGDSRSDAGREDEISNRLDSRLDDRPPAPVESALYFAVAEALANVVKHSCATTARVILARSADRLSAVVWDDGIGGADSARGTGLAGVRRRLSAFDGTIAVTSPLGGPTIVTMELPCGLSSPRTSPF